jgi:DNA-directed RNA polymerase subunit D
MKIITNTEEKLVFADEIDESLANAIRRSISEIPTLAIDEVDFYTNDSALYDEIIAHRLGLVPLKNEKLTQIKECSCKGKGCNKCTIELKLVAEGEMVYSGKLKGNAEVVYDKMPIVLLIEGQKLEAVCHARIGTGKEHTKFTPGFAYYRHVAEIDGKDCDCKECIEACPQNILEEDKGRIKVSDVYKCDMCNACVEACEKKGKGKIEVKPGKEIMFFIESYGSMPAKNIFQEAVKILSDNLEEVEKAVK